MRISLCLLLCSAGVFMVTLTSPTIPRGLDPNLNEIIELINAYNNSPSKDLKEYVDSAEEFTRGVGRCGEKFFCAVHGTLRKHLNSTKYKQAKQMVKILHNFIKRKHMNCTNTLVNATNAPNTTEQRMLRSFLTDIDHCSRCRNWNSSSPSC